MHTMTFTALIAIVAILALLLSRPVVRATGRHHSQSCPATAIAAHSPAEAEQFPRLSRNHWARRDLARMLMTDADYAGRITPPRAVDREQSTPTPAPPSF